MAPHPTTVAFPVKVWPDKGSLRRCHSGQFRNDSNNSVWDYYVKQHLADPTNELISKGDSISIRQMSSSMLLSFQSGWIVIAFDVYLVQTWVLDKDPNCTKNLTPAHRTLVCEPLVVVFKNLIFWTIATKSLITSTFPTCCPSSSRKILCLPATTWTWKISKFCFGFFPNLVRVHPLAAPRRGQH